LANVIEIIAQYKDQLSAGLAQASGKLNAFEADVSSGAVGFAAYATAATVAAGAAVAVGAALAGAAIKLSEQALQLRNLADSSGIAADRLQVIQSAFRRGGVDSELLATGLARMSRAMETNQALMQRLGVTSRDQFTAFRELATAIVNTSDIAERNTLIFEIFGRGGTRLIPVLREIATSYDSLATAAQASGNVLSDRQMTALLNVHSATEDLKESVGGLWKRMGADAAAPVEQGTKALNGFVVVLQKALDLRDRMDQSFYGSKSATAFGPPMLPPDAAADAAAAYQKQLAKMDADSYEYMLQHRAKPLPAPKPPGSAGPYFPGGPFGGIPDLSFLENPLRKPGSVSSSFLGGPLGAIPDLTEPLAKAADRVKEFSKTVIGSFDDIGRSVYSGFFTVLTNLTNKTQTFGSAMKTIWQSIVQGIEAAIANLLASTAVKGLLRLLGVGLTVITGNPIFTQLGNAAATGVGGGSNVTASPTRGGDTFILQSFSPASTLASLVSPTGALRGANSRLIELAAMS